MSIFKHRSPFCLGQALFLLSFFAVLAPALHAAENAREVPVILEGEDTLMNVLCPANSWDGFGFMPVQVVVNNTKSARAHSWTFRFSVTQSRGRGDEITMESMFKVTAPARQTYITVLWVPGAWAGSDGNVAGITVNVEGDGIEGGRWSGSLTNRWGDNELRIATTPEIDAHFNETEEFAGQRNLGLSVINPKAWPADWRTWSPFSIVMIRESEYASLDAARKASLREWVALGGRLFLIKGKFGEPVPDWNEERPNAKSTTLGLGQIVEGDILSAFRLDARNHGQSLYIPPKHVAATEDETEHEQKQEDTTEQKEDELVVQASPTEAHAEPQTIEVGPVGTATISKPATPYTRSTQWLDYMSQQRVNPTQRVAQMLTTDDEESWQLSQATWWLVGFLIAFAVIIGPVNLFVWAPAGKRHRLFFTVPVISLSAALLLACVIVFHDGFGGAGTRRALVVLLQGENKAVIVQEQLARTGMLLGKGFPLPEDTLLAKVSTSDRSNELAGKTLSRTENAAQGDWFTSRSVQKHTLIRVTPTRARIEWVSGGRNDTAPIIQSSFAGTLRDFVYIDRNLGVWVLPEVPPGKRVTLRRLKRGEERPEIMSQFTRMQAETYYAIGEGMHDLAPLGTLGSITWKHDSILVSGQLEGAKQ